MNRHTYDMDDTEDAGTTIALFFGASKLVCA